MTGVGTIRNTVQFSLNGKAHRELVLRDKIPKHTVSSTFLLPQGPEFDEEEESELTVTELKERASKQKAELERRMMGENSDEEEEEDGEGDLNKSQSRPSNEDSGCSWGMGESFCSLFDDR